MEVQAMATQLTITKRIQGLLTAGLVAMLVACGGGGSSSSEETLESSIPVTARGVITQLGSIWVTGCRYVAAPGGSYKNDDDDSASFDDYEVGQLVSIRGRKSDDGVSCFADEVEYEAEIEGTADVDGKINGIEIVQTPKTNNTVPGSPDPLVNGNRYEVSGIWIDNFTLEATFIKVDDDANDEIKGIVKNDGPTSFEVRQITFNWTGTPNVSDGDFVEVHFDSCVGTAPNVTCNASKVEIEDDFFDRAEGMEVEIEGAVDLDTTGCPAEAEFKVDGVCIDSDSKPAQWMDGLTEFADLSQGARVEAEGHMVNSSPMDYLRADKIKGRGNRGRISSVAENVVTVPPCAFTLVEGNISVTVLDCANAFEGETDSNGPLTINNLAGEEVEVRGVRTNVPGEMMAIRIKTEGLSGGGDRHEIRAEVDKDGTDTETKSLTVMGITSIANSFTELEVGDVEIAPGDGSTTDADIEVFLLEIDADDNASNGPRDVVEMEFDITTGFDIIIDGGATRAYIAEEWEIEEEDD
jgi:hypothetical protein